MAYIIVFILILIIAVSFFCEYTLYHPERNDKQHEFDTLPNWGHDIRPFYERTEHRPFTLDVPNGYSLSCEIIPARKDLSFADGKRRVVILVHGRTANRYTMLSHGEAYHDLGFDLVIYDQRAHGESGGKTCSMGHHEAEDLVFLAEHVKALFGDGCIYGIHGESMGAAAVMLAAPSLPWISFVCEDAGYAELRQEIDDSLMFKAKLPAFPFGALTALFSDLMEDFKLSDTRPIESVRKTAVPMLFIHGALDKFVPTENVYRLFDAKNGPKMLHVFEDVPHAKSALMHNTEYRELLNEFLVNYKLI